MMRRNAWGAAGTLLVALGCANPEGRDAGTSPAPAGTRIDSLVRLADSTYRVDRPEAVRLWNVALSEAGPVGDSANIARAWTGLGMSARLDGDWVTSRRLGEQALALKQRLGMSDQDLFRSYNALGLVAWESDRLTDAVTWFGLAREAARTTGDSVSLGIVTINDGLVAKNLGAFAQARRSFLEAIEITRATGDSTRLGRAFNNLGNLEVTLGNALSGIASLELARRIAREAEDPVTELNARGQLALAYNVLGEPQRAFALLDSGLSMARELSRPAEVGENLTLMADLFLEAGDYQHALQYYEQALVVTDSLGLSEERGTIIRNRARTYAEMGNLTAAMGQAREALQIHRDSGFKYAEFDDLLALARLSQRSGQRAEAEGHLQAAERIATELDAPIARTQVAIVAADVAAQARQWDRVLQNIERARPTLYLAGNAAEAEGLSLQARALAELGRTDAALAAGRQALQAVERVRANYGTGELRTMYTSQKSGVYARQALTLLSMGRVTEALEVADAARGRAMLEHLTQAQSELRSAGNRESLLAREELLRRIDALVGQLREREQDAPRERSSDYVRATAGLRDSVDGLRHEYAALLARGGGGSSAVDAVIGLDRPEIADVVRTLKPDELLLEYLVTDDRLLLFAVTSGGVNAHVIEEPASRLASRVQLARDLLRRPDAEAEARGVLQALFDIVLGPVARSGALAKAQRLILVPHGVLTYLPFAALVNSATSRYVAQEQSILHLPTSAVLPVLRDQELRASRSNRAEVFAPVPSLLPATRDEAKSVARALRAVVHTGRGATEERFRAALAGGGIVHIATHATLNARNPLFTHIQLAGSQRSATNNGRLEVHELLGAKLNAMLVFLSGCETAAGSAWSTQFDTGEDYATLEQAFLFAGVRNVVATLWRIDDAGAAEFARHFYEKLGDRDYPEAMAEAQRRLMADARFRSPYYWAAYQVSGSGVGQSAIKTAGRVR